MLMRKIWATGASLALTMNGGAATTTWTNAAGGSWINAANWSNGVPTAADTAVLPPLGADGYTIAMPASATVALLAVGGGVPGGDVVLSGGSLTVTGETSIGMANTAAVRVDAGILQTGALHIGISGGDGALRLRNGAIVGANGLVSGNGGSGLVDVAGGSKLLASSMNLSDASTLHIEAVLESEPGVLVDTIYRGGTLVVTAGPGLSLPSPAMVVLRSWAPLLGDFGTVQGPIIGGKAAPISQQVLSIQVDAFDPVVALQILLEHEPVFAGFEYVLSVVANYSSGVIQTECDPWPCSVVWSVEGEDASVHDWSSTSELVVPSLAPCVVTGTFVGTTYEVSASRTVEPVEAPPFQFEKVAVAADGTPADVNVLLDPPVADWTPDGRFVAFASKATNLVTPPVVSSAPQIYVKDRWTGAVDLVSVDGAWGGADSFCTSPAISADGRFVVFRRTISGGSEQVWLRDRWLATTRLVSHTPMGDPANSYCDGPRISGDGSTVTFWSKASNLAYGTPPDVYQVFAYDVPSDSLSVVSSPSPGVFANDHCERPRISDDGARIVFETRATNLVDDNSGTWRIVMVDRTSMALVRIDVNNESVGSDGASRSAWIDGDGSRVAFKSTATNLGALPDGAATDVFVRDLDGSATICVSDLPPDGFPNLPLGQLRLSQDGSVVAYVVSSNSGSVSGYVRRVQMATLAVDWGVTNPWGDPALVDKDTLALTADGASTLFFASPEGLIAGSLGTEVMPLVQTFAPVLPADLNHDGLVNAGDLARLLGAWGTSGPGDLDGDGLVGASDVGLLLASWTN